MKLSNLSTDKTLDVICDLTPYISEIVTDKEISKIMSDKLKATEENKEDIMEQGFNKGIENILKFVPIILKTHRNAVYGILSIMNEKEIEKIKGQPVTETIKQVTELLKDEELRAVFTSLKI